MSKLVARASVAALIATSLAACSSDPVVPPAMDASVAATLDSIEILSASFTVVEGAEIRFSAIGKYSDESNRNVTTEVEWTSDSTDVATVGATGLANAVSAGTATIKAELDGVTASVTLTVLRSPIRSIDVEPNEVELLIGATQQFGAVARLQDDSVEDVSASVTWISSDETVATVDASGLVTAVAAGAAKITARDEGTGASDSADITARAPNVVSVVIEPDPVELEVGQTQAMTATLYYEDNSTADVTSEVTWSSNEDGVANVDANGLLTTTSAGRATIQAVHEPSGVSDEARVTVNPPTLVGLRVAPQVVTLELRQRVSFAATAVYSDNSERPVTGGVTWTSSDDSVVSISNMPGTLGQAQAVGVGTVTIVATNEDTGLSSEDSGMSATITVNSPVATSVIVVPPNPHVAAGLSQRFQAFEVFSDNTGAEISSTAIWASSNPAVATVDATGLVTTLTVGTATISATDPATGINSDTSGTSALLTVDPPILLGITVTPGAASLVIGGTQQFVATGNYSDGVTRDISADVAWSTGDAGLTINAGGLATAVNPGVYTVSAEDVGSGVSSDLSQQSATVLVSASQLLSIAVSPTTITIPPGATTQFQAMGTFADTSVIDVTALVQWSSSNPNVATVSNANGARGVVTAIAAGSVGIIAQEPGGGVSSDDSAQSGGISVPSGITLQSLAVTPPRAVFDNGRTFQFEATGTFSDNSTYNMTEAVTWSSSNSGVASVSNTPGTRGLTTGTGIGAALINVTHVATGVNSSTTTTGAIAVVEQGIEIADIVHYEIEEGSGDTLTNRAPGQPNGTIVNGPATWVSGAGAPTLSSTYITMTGNTYVDPGLGTATYTDLTIDFWYREEGGTSLEYVWYGNNGSSFRCYINSPTSGTVYIASTPGGSGIAGTTNVRDGQWHHIAYVLSATEGSGTLYVDGVQENTTNYNGSMTLGFDILGDSNNGGTDAFSIDRWRMFSTAKTAAEIAEVAIGLR